MTRKRGGALSGGASGRRGCGALGGDRREGRHLARLFDDGGDLPPLVGLSSARTKACRCSWQQQKKKQGVEGMKEGKKA